MEDLFVRQTLAAWSIGISGEGAFQNIERANHFIKMQSALIKAWRCFSRESYWQGLYSQALNSQIEARDKGYSETAVRSQGEKAVGLKAELEEARAEREAAMKEYEGLLLELLQQVEIK